MIVNEEHKADLIRLAKEYKYSVQSYPGVQEQKPKEKYLEYLSLMYDPEIIKIVLELPILPKTLSIKKVGKKLNIDKDDLISNLEGYVKRGFVTRLGKNNYARPSPLQIHDSPFILQENLDRDDIVEFARLSREYFDEGYYKTWETNRKGIPRTRVLTVSEKVEPSHQIMPMEEVYTIIDNHSDFAIFPCPCRMRKEVEGIRKCKDKYPIHNCITFGIFAKQMIELGDPAIKPISKEEVKEEARKAAKLGLVHMTDNNANAVRILCACCECCCGNLAGLTRLDNPKAIARANYISSIDEELCAACGTCIERCKFGAITLNEIAHVDVNKCVGCGLCAVTCPEGAIIMKRLEREQLPE
ncbi:MAG: 4Fe-4S binding protein [Promethearchaeota archaeon]